LALESASYISQLTPSNPPEGDPAVQAADHLRLIKSVLQATFPNLNGPVTSTPLQLSSNVVPVGGVIAWYGSLATIPAGWGLCNGSTYSKLDGSGNITSPNLENAFLLGAGGLFTPGATGGATSATVTGSDAGTVLTQANLPSYNLPVTDSGHSHGVTDPGHYHFPYSGSSGSGVTYSLTGYHGTPLSTPQVESSATTGISINNGTTGLVVSSGGSGTAHTHTITSTVPTVPPYVALAYIIKL